MFYNGRLYYKHFSQKYESSSISVGIEADETEEDENPKVLCPLLAERYMSFQSKIIEMAKNDPVAFGPALEAYLQQGGAMSTSYLLSAMHCFGMNNGVEQELFVMSNSSC